MSAWITAWPVVLVTLAMIVLPGSLVASAAGARGWDRLTLAAPVSFALAGIIAIGAQLARLPFTPVVFSATTAVVSLLLIAVRFLLRRGGFRLVPLGSDARRAAAEARPWIVMTVTALAVALPAALIGRRYLRAMQSPDNIAQLFDNVFHLNAVTYIAQTQQGSSLSLGNLTEASRGFYPAAMHDLAALVVQIGGFPVTHVANATALVVATFVWPLSVIFLTTRVFGAKPIAILVAGVFSAAFGAFPFLLMSWGLLAPLLVATAMVPLAIGLIVELFGAGAGEGPFRPAAAIALAAVFSGLALTHPSTVVAALLFAAPFVLFSLTRTLSSAVHPTSAESAGRRHTRGRLLAVAAYLAATTLAFIVARPDLSTAPWQAVESTPTAVGSVLTAAPLGFAPVWAVAIPLAIGIVVAVRSPLRWWPLLAMFLIAGVIYVVGASFAEGFVRTTLTSVWYRDNYRLAALLPVATIPLAVLGVTAVVDRAAGLMRTAYATMRRRPSHDRDLGLVIVTAGVITVAILVPATQGNQLRQAEARMHGVYSYLPDARLISPDERSVLERVDEYVPATGTVVGDPATGASLVYTFADRRALAPHILGTRSPDEQYLLDHWDEADTDPRVCDLIRAHNAYWALDFPGPDALGRESAFAGLSRIDQAHGYRELASDGPARLFEVTACGTVPR